jgi:hypothetical protein
MPPPDFRFGGVAAIMPEVTFLGVFGAIDASEREPSVAPAINNAFAA